MGKIWTCRRVFGRNAQDISLWGLMRGDHVKNYRTHYFCPSAHKQGDKDLTAHRLPIVEHFPSAAMTGSRDCDNECMDRTVGLEVV